MTFLLADLRLWWLLAGIGLGVLFCSLFFLAAYLPGQRLPRVIGAIRRRCLRCPGGWASDADLDLCSDCRRALDEAEQRRREVLR